jgi:ComF family protein
MPGICGICQQHLPPFDRTHALFAYQPPVDAFIHQLKYRQQLTYARLLGDLLAEGFAARLAPPYPELVLPVPLHWTRLWQRGFNPAVELAKPVARRLGVPVALDSVRRVRATPPQARLAAAQRQTNVRGAFALVKPLRAAHVAVFDDVMTSGNTAGEIARLLRQAGAARVEVWAAARTVPRWP